MAGLQDKIKDFLANFDKGQLVGVDIGLSAVKIALLSRPKKNVFRLEKYAAIPLSEAAIIEDDIQKPDEIVEAIAAAFEQTKIEKKIVCLGMSGPNTMTKRLQVPDGTAAEVEDYVLWESEQYIPFGADDSEVDFYVIGDIEDDDVKDVIISACRIDITENYVDLLKQVGLIPKVIDLNVFAITNLFEATYQKEMELYNQEGVIIIDFGAQVTTIIVYKKKGPVLTKEINWGGVLITEDIQRLMGLSYEEAEDLKITGDEKGNLPEEIVSIIDNQISILMEEIKKVLNFYIAAGSSEQIPHCFVTGGGCRLPGLSEALSEVLNIEINIFNPFDRIEYDKKAFNQNELDQIMTTGVVAMGLGLRGI